jgi:polyhydroxyalkanoate synthase
MHWAWFAQIDGARRLQGALLDAAGLRPPESAYCVIHSEPGLKVRRYGDGDAAGPLVLILPAPIKRPYIWDLAPEVSAVRRCLAAGPVVLADWQRAPPQFGLAHYAERLVLNTLDAAGGAPAVLVGHSLGGLLAAIFSALHPDRVRGVVLLATPLNFGPEAHAFMRLAPDLGDARLPDALPGSFLGMASFNAAPVTFGWERWADAALSCADPEKLRRHMQVERWALDEFPLPRHLVSDLVSLIRCNRFARGQLEIGARTAGPASVTAPLLCVMDPLCFLVPPATVLPFLESAASSDKSVLRYERDAGVSLQHVGPLVSPRAHATLWPGIIQWMQAH